MNRYVILADILVAVMGTLGVVFGMTSAPGVIHDFALIYGSMCLGYVFTTYLNEVEE